MRSITRIGLALALTGPGAPALAQGTTGDAFLDPTPPDLSAPRSEREYRTCPDREDPPAWIENLTGWEADRGLLVSEIYQARTYERIIATGDCSCAVKAPPWDVAEAEYQEDYAALDLGAVSDARSDFQRLSGSLRRDARSICQEQGNW